MTIVRRLDRTIQELAETGFHWPGGWRPELIKKTRHRGKLKPTSLIQCPDCGAWTAAVYWLERTRPGDRPGEWFISGCAAFGDVTGCGFSLQLVDDAGRLDMELLAEGRGFVWVSQSV